MQITEEQISNWFTYHKGTPEKQASYDAVNESSKALCRLILERVPDCDDRDEALRTLRRLRMDINLAIACNG